MKKSLTISPRLLNAGSHSADECSSMRMHADGAMHAAPSPGSILSDTHYTPLAYGRSSSGESVVVLADGPHVALLSGGDIFYTATLDSEVRCSVVSDNVATLMTRTRSYRLNLSKPALLPTHADVADSMPGIHFAAASSGHLAVQIPSFPLSYPYTSWHSLTATDINRLSSAMLSAYEETAASAAALGVWMQPLTVRYKLYDSNDRELFASMPVVVASSAPWQLTNDVCLGVQHSDEGISAVVGVTLTPECFRLAVDLPGSAAITEAARAMATQVVKMRVFAMPQVHPVSSGKAECRCEGQMHASVLRAWFPGASAGLMLPAAALSERVARLAMLMEGNETLIGELDHPFSGERRRIVMGRPAASTGSATALGESDLALRLLRKAGKAAPDGNFGLYAPPHSLSADAACLSGDNVVWGNVRLKPFEGYDLDQLTSGNCSEGPVRASMRVTLSLPGGEQMHLVHDCSCVNASTELSPVVSYPCAAATRIDVRALMPDGSVREASIPLSPDAGGCHAFGFSPSLEPLPLTPSAAQEFVPFTPSGELIRCPTAVASCPSHDPLHVRATATVGAAAVSQIVPAWGANASWDYASGRFYVMCSDGVHALSLGSDGCRLRTSLLDPRTAVSRHGAAFTPHGVLALAGGDLVCITGTRACTLLHRVGGTAVGYDNAHDELWIACHDHVKVWQHPFSGYYTRPIDGIAALLPVADHLMIRQGNQLLVTSIDSTERVVPMRWSGEVASGPLPHAAFMDMTASEAEGSLTLNTELGCLTVINFAGCLAHPLAWRMPGPRRAHLRATLQLEASPDFRALCF